MDTHTFDEEGVRLLLDGDEEDIRQAMTQIHQQLQKPLSHWLRKRFPGLSTDDFADVWSEFLIDLLDRARHRQFDSRPALFPLLCTILTARAVDRLRRIQTQARNLPMLARLLKGTHVGHVWGRLDALERQEVMELIREAVAGMPAQQRIVLQVYADHFPESRRMGFLRQEVSRLVGEPQTLAAVKRALQESRRKIRTLLRRKGYALDGEET